MHARTIILTAALLFVTSLGSGQGFSVFLYNNSLPLLQFCDGPPYPDGTLVYIYWDSNANGPDAVDPQPEVCAQPPLCEDGPVGTVNYNQFPLNGEALGIGPGLFASDYDFQSVGVLPMPPRYYLVIRCPNGERNWVSNVFTLVPGPQEVNAYEWFCTPCAVCCDPCIPTPSVTFDNYGQQCITVCEGSETIVNVAVFPETTPCDVRKFIVDIFPCYPGWPGCSFEPEGSATLDLLAWSFDEATHTFSNVIHGVAAGCMVVNFDYFLSPPPVTRMDPADGVPQSSCQAVGWGNYTLPCIGPFAPGEYPQLLESPGCNAGNPCNTYNLPPPDGYTSQTYFYPNLGYYFWYGTPTGELGGYICLTMADIELQAVTDLVIQPQPADNSIHLFWSPTAGATRYDIYVSTNPDSVFAAASFISAVTDTHYVHAGAIAEPFVMRFYGARAVSEMR